MSDASSLTVAKLKALCVLHDQPTSGRKADLVARLLEAGLDRATIGLSEPREAEPSDEEVISLELEPEPVQAPKVPVPKVDDMPLPVAEEEEVLEAEVLDAIPIDDDAPEEDTPPEVVPPVVPLPGSKSTGPTTLFDMVKTPKAAAVVLVLLLLGA